MKKFLKGLKVIGIALLSLVILTGIVLFIKINGKSITARIKIDGIEAYAKDVDKIEVPSEAKIIGLGEATHGNAEFQKLKLTLMQKLAANDGCRAIVIEMGFGDGLHLDAYVQGEEGTAEDVLVNVGYALYQTEEMVELLDWIRGYNGSASDADKIHIYGIDMQSISPESAYLATYCKENGIAGIETALRRLEELSDPMVEMEDDDREIYTEVEEAIKSAASDTNVSDYVNAMQALCAVFQNIDAPGYSEDPEAYGEYRDECMTRNLRWVLEKEEEAGHGKIMLTAHNGHLTKGEAISYGEHTFGNRLAEMYGDAYFVIGTEFFNANVNIHTAGTWDENYERKNHKFCSGDPLAYQAKNRKDGMYYLDFATVPKKSTKLYEQIHSEIPMGAVGEGYSIYFYLFQTFRENMIPAECYDAVIYVYDATPIHVIESK